MVINTTCLICKKDYNFDIDQRQICPHCNYDQTVDFEKKSDINFGVKVFDSESYKKIFGKEIKNSKQLRSYVREHNLTEVGDDKNFLEDKMY